jgi:tRNA G10  N-methylase Trm11
MACDLTQSPLRKDVLFDAIICDRASHVDLCNFLAPYGVRAGAKKLGSKKNLDKPYIRSDGNVAHAYFPLYALFSEI